MVRRSRPIHQSAGGRIGGLPADVINPGQGRKQKVLDPLRHTHTIHGVFRPANQWRSQSNRGHHQQPDVRNRALLLAKQLPWLPQYNFARS